MKKKIKFINNTGAPKLVYIIFYNANQAQVATDNHLIPNNGSWTITRADLKGIKYIKGFTGGFTYALPSTGLFPVERVTPSSLHTTTKIYLTDFVSL